MLDIKKIVAYLKDVKTRATSLSFPRTGMLKGCQRFARRSQVRGLLFLGIIDEINHETWQKGALVSVLRG